MSFDNNDKKFLNIFLSYSKYFEACMDKTLEYKLNLNIDIATLKSVDIEATNIKTGKTKSALIILLGMYNVKNEEFIWFEPMRELLRSSLENAFQRQGFKLKEVFGSDEIIDKIYQPKIKIDYKYHYAIVYFLSFFNPAFNLVKFETEDGSAYTYALIKLGIKCKDPPGDELWDKIDLYKGISNVLSKISSLMSRTKSKKVSSKKRKSKKSKSKTKRSKTKRSKTKK